jgi:hypothetical protein
MELDISTFGDLIPDPHTRVSVSPRERMQQMLAPGSDEFLIDGETPTHIVVAETC